jgi:hypothetical protein
VTYVTRDLSTRKSKLINAKDEQEGLVLLRDLFGVSGYVGVARNLVFLEGDNSSQDRKFYSILLPKKGSDIKLIPASSSGQISRINSAVLSILEANVGSMNFFMIRDRDYLTDQMIEKYEGHSSGRVFVLRKHEIENYLLNFEIINLVLQNIFDIQLDAAKVADTLYQCALSLSGEVIRDMASYRLNLLVRPQDFSQGNLFSATSFFKSAADGLVLDDAKFNILKSKLQISGNRILTETSSQLSSSAIEVCLEECALDVSKSLQNGTWKNIFPGKELLSRFAKNIGLSNSISLQNSIIKELAAQPNEIDIELTEIFRKISNS